MSQQDMNGHPENNDSQCYFVQLQIDSFLDGELSSEQQKIFATHMHDCSACAAELQFAQTLHDTVMDLPLLNCTDEALEPINRLGGERGEHGEDRGASERASRGRNWLDEFSDWLTAAPAALRYGAPAAVAVVVTLLLLPVINDRGETPAAVASTGNAASSSGEYSQEDVLAALGDLNTAISYLNEVSQRTETMIGGRFVLIPLQESLDASFQRVSDQNNDPLDDDPI